MCVYFFIFQRTLEQSKARRKRRFIRRYTLKKISCKVPPTAIEDYQSNNEKLKVKSSHDQFLCYQMYKEKYMGKVNNMLLDSLKKKYLE